MTGLATIMALLRGLHLAAMLSLLGTAGFIAWMLPVAGIAPAALCRGLWRLGWASAGLALLTGAAWLGLQGAALADADNLADGLAAVPLVAMHSRFGNMLVIRLGLLLTAMLVSLTGGGWTASDQEPTAATGLQVHFIIALTAGALGVQGFIGHAGATGEATAEGLVLTEALHLLAAGLWLGALIPLWLSLYALSPAQAAAVCERFSPIGLGCVLVLAGSGLIQALELVGSVPGLLGTTYGHIALLKIAMFLAALALAAANRLWLTDRLVTGAAGGRRDLLISVGIETVLGVAIVSAAGFLASTVPAVHSDPVWPFSWQFSLVAINEDADYRREVVLSLLLIGGAVLLLAAALFWRRFRLPALAILAAVALQRGPSLTLLVIDAYPTSFQSSPTGFTARSISRGEVLFAENCVTCHGPEGEGDGPAAAGLRIKPTDLTMAHVQGHADGTMFWWLTNGIEDPEGGLAMPGFAASLSAEDRWAVIDYVRAYNAGVAMRRDPASALAVEEPGFAVACDNVAAGTTDDLRGRALHIIVGDVVDEDRLPVSSQTGIPTVTLIVPADPSIRLKPTDGICVAADPFAGAAFAVLANLPLPRVAGTEFLVDPDGWVRAVRPAGAVGGWGSADALLAAIREICAHPIEQPRGGQHDHHR